MKNLPAQIGADSEFLAKFLFQEMKDDKEQKNVVAQGEKTEENKDLKKQKEDVYSDADKTEEFIAMVEEQEERIDVKDVKTEKVLDGTGALEKYLEYKANPEKYFDTPEGYADFVNSVFTALNRAVETSSKSLGELIEEGFPRVLNGEDIKSFTDYIEGQGEGTVDPEQATEFFQTTFAKLHNNLGAKLEENGGIDGKWGKATTEAAAMLQMALISFAQHSAGQALKSITAQVPTEEPTVAMEEKAVPEEKKEKKSFAVEVAAGMPDTLRMKEFPTREGVKKLVNIAKISNPGFPLKDMYYLAKSYNEEDFNVGMLNGKEVKWKDLNDAIKPGTEQTLSIGGVESAWDNYSREGKTRTLENLTIKDLKKGINVSIGYAQETSDTKYSFEMRKVHASLKDVGELSIGRIGSYDGPDESGAFVEDFGIKLGNTWMSVDQLNASFLNKDGKAFDPAGTLEDFYNGKENLGDIASRFSGNLGTVRGGIGENGELVFELNANDGYFQFGGRDIATQRITQMEDGNFLFQKEDGSSARFELGKSSAGVIVDGKEMTLEKYVTEVANNTYEMVEGKKQVNVLISGGGFIRMRGDFETNFTKEQIDYYGELMDNQAIQINKDFMELDKAVRDGNLSTMQTIGMAQDFVMNSANKFVYMRNEINTPDHIATKDYGFELDLGALAKSFSVESGEGYNTLDLFLDTAATDFGNNGVLSVDKDFLETFAKADELGLKREDLLTQGFGWGDSAEEFGNNAKNRLVDEGLDTFTESISKYYGMLGHLKKHEFGRISVDKDGFGATLKLLDFAKAPGTSIVGVMTHGKARNSFTTLLSEKQIKERGAVDGVAESHFGVAMESQNKFTGGLGVVQAFGTPEDFSANVFATGNMSYLTGSNLRLGMGGVEGRDVTTLVSADDVIEGAKAYGMGKEVKDAETYLDKAKEGMWAPSITVGAGVQNRVGKNKRILLSADAAASGLPFAGKLSNGMINGAVRVEGDLGVGVVLPKGIEVQAKLNLTNSSAKWVGQNMKGVGGVRLTAVIPINRS